MNNNIKDGDKVKRASNNKERYSRQTMFPQWGEAGQAALGRARVLVVGAGGLGSAVLSYLCSAGTGTIGIADGDAVSLSNLPRQVLYTEAEIGMSKAECAAERLRALNSGAEIVCHNCFIDSSNAEGIISRYDYVIDACDNFATRFLVNDCCIRLGKPFIYGSISGMSGQVSVFGVKDSNGLIRSYRELYDEQELTVKDNGAHSDGKAASTDNNDAGADGKAATTDGNVTHIDSNGAYRDGKDAVTDNAPADDKAVLPPAPAMVGAVQLAQMMLLCGGFGEPLIGRLWTIDLRTMESYIIEL